MNPPSSRQVPIGAMISRFFSRRPARSNGVKSTRVASREETALVCMTADYQPTDRLATVSPPPPAVSVTVLLQRLSGRRREGPRELADLRADPVEPRLVGAHGRVDPSRDQP